MLYIFDADGTLCDRKTGELLPNTLEVINALPEGSIVAIATNQGGVGFRWWMENTEDGKKFASDKNIDVNGFPTKDSAKAQYKNVANQVGATFLKMCFTYTFSNGNEALGPEDNLIAPFRSDEWNPMNRKPRGGMIEDIVMLAKAAREIKSKNQVVFIGDADGRTGSRGKVRDEDVMAARDAGVRFIPADEFFNRG